VRTTALAHAVVAVACATSKRVAMTQFGTLSERDPGRANTPVLLNVDQIHGAPFASAFQPHSTAFITNSQLSLIRSLGCIVKAS